MPETLLMTGRNDGLTGLRHGLLMLVPAVEYLVFDTLERLTVRRWGVQR